MILRKGRVFPPVAPVDSKLLRPIFGHADLERFFGAKGHVEKRQSHSDNITVKLMSEAQGKL